MAPTQPKHAETRRNTTTTTPAKRDATTCQTQAEGIPRATGGQGNDGRETGRQQEGQQARRTRYARLFLSILLLTPPIPIPLLRTQKTHPIWVCLSCPDSYLRRLPSVTPPIETSKTHPKRARFQCFMSSSSPPFKHQPHIHMDVFLVFGHHLHHPEYRKRAILGVFSVYGLLPPLKRARNDTFWCTAFFHHRNAPFRARFGAHFPSNTKTCQFRCVFMIFFFVFSYFI